MIASKDVNVKCPYCGRDISLKIFTDVDTNYAKDLPERIIDGSWFDSNCKYCKKEVSLRFDFSYHDVVHDTWVVLINNNYLEYKKKVADLRSKGRKDGSTRLVTNKYEMREKVACLEKGRDDRVIELCKAYMLAQFSNQNPDFALQTVFYTIEDSREIIYFISEDGKTKYAFLENDLYELIRSSFWYKLYEPLSGVYQLVDIEWAKAFIAATGVKLVTIDQFRQEAQVKNVSQDGRTNSAPQITIASNNQQESKTETASQNDTQMTNNVPAVKTGRPQVRFCRKCGARIPEDSAFCQFCGTGVIIDVESENNQSLEASAKEEEINTKSDEAYLYVEAPNGWTVRIPASKYDNWKKAQEELANGTLDLEKEKQAMRD